MMKLAVRVLNAFPEVLRKAAVTAFEKAASVEGTTAPSRPAPFVPTLRMVVSDRFIDIGRNPMGDPIRSTTAMVTRLLSAKDAEPACASIFRMSSGVRFVAGTGVGTANATAEPGVGTAFRSSGSPPPT